MPRSRLRITNKAQWSSDTLLKAEELMKKGHSIRQAAKALNIPFSTFQKRLKRNDSSGPRLGRLPVFSAEEEKDLADQIKYSANTFYGYTGIQIRKIAYQYAEDKNIKHNFDRIARMAGYDWLKGFLIRNDICVRKSEPINMNRITDFNNRTEIECFYILLEELMDKYKFLSKNIYNCDATKISTVQDANTILAPKGLKRDGSTNWEKEQNITLLCAMSAAGGFVPPMLIFSSKKMTPQLEKDGPAGAIYKCSENGWINENLFLEWLEHFTCHTKPSQKEPVLFILDNHASHTSLSVYDHCERNHIHMISLPSQTSYRMQPLDLTFFGPLKVAYKRECDLFLKTAEKITAYDVASILNIAYSTVASTDKGESGFRAAGIFPLNPNIFSEENFNAAEVPGGPKVVVESCFSSLIDPVPSISKQVDPPALISVLTSENQIDPSSSIKDPLSMPSKTVVMTSKDRIKQHAKILNQRSEREKKKDKGKEPKTQKKKTKICVLKDKISSSESDRSLIHICDDDDDEVTDNTCSICYEFGRNNELLRPNSCVHTI